MDFKSLLQTMLNLNEAETKVTKTGKVHKGDYGTSYEAGDEGVKKAETTRGRGRPKKGSDEATGEVKKYDTKSVGDVFGGGKKPKKEVGTVSKKHSLKEYMEAAEEAINEGTTIEKKGGRVHKGSYGTSYEAGDEGVKKATTQRGRGRPKKDADETGEVKKYDTKSLGNVFGGGKAPKKPVGKVSASNKLKEADQVQIKPASQSTQVISQGNKTLGTVTNPQLANQIKQAMGQGQLTLNPNDEEMAEGKDEGKPGKNFAKIAKSAGAHYGSKAAGERVAGAVRNKLKAQGKLEEAAKPDFLDVDKDKNKKESFKKAVSDKSKKKVAEGRDQEASEYLDEKVARVLAREKPGMKAVSSNDEFYGAIYHELIACGLTPKAARYKVSYDEDFIADVASAYAHYQQNPSLDEGSVDDFRIDGVKPTNDFTKPGGSMAQPKGTPTVANRPVANPTPFGTDPIQATTDRAINFISGLRKPTNPFSESKTMKDMQVESWSKQLDSLLNEGITVSSSQGQQGAPDSVSVTASDADAQQLMAVLRSAGIGGFGGGAEQPQVDAYGVMTQGEEEPTGTGTEPQQAPGVVGDDGDMLSMLKKMSGLSSEPTQGGEEAGQDYEDEEVGALEPTDGGEEEGSDDQFAGDEGSDEEGSEEGTADEEEDEEQTDEGNAFTGKLKKTPQGGSFSQGGKSYKDTSSIEEGGFDPEQPEGGAGGGDIEKCHECGGSMNEGHDCSDQEQVEENFSNDAGGDAMGDAQLMQLKALLSVGNDLHKMKTSQAMGNPVRVTESKQMINEWKKLSGI